MFLVALEVVLLKKMKCIDFLLVSWCYLCFFAADVFGEFIIALLF